MRPGGAFWNWKKLGASLVMLAIGGALAIGPAVADGFAKPRSLKDAPAEAPKSDLQISYNFALTSEYVFRGFSQSAEDPTVQAGADLTYKWFYAGIWSSGIDFGRDPTITGNDFAHIEVDLYAGIKPVIGKLTFDFGGIYYAYPGARDGALSIYRELDYFEFKAGVSVEAWKDATVGVTVFYSPEYTNETGKVWTVEGAFAQVLPKIRDIVPTFSALVGYQKGEDLRYLANVTNNNGDDYFYWNAGVALAFHERFSVDFRYWDTNVKSNNAAGGGIDGFCTGRIFQCDERFVATAKVTY